MACSKIGLPLPPGIWRGTVHSVFEHSVNVFLGEGRPFLVIHSFAGMIPPGSFYIEDLDTGHVKAGMEVGADGGSIHIGESCIRILKECRYFDSSLPALEKNRFFLEPYREMIDEKRKTQQVPETMAREICRRLHEGAGCFFEALERRDLPAMETAAGRCIGLGTGLTPSGDDLLSGILAVLKCFDPAGFQLAVKAVLPELHKTNDISRSYLLWACGGYGSDVVIHTIEGFMNEAQNEAAAKLLQLGHTSGADILDGLVMAAEYLQEQVKRLDGSKERSLGKL